MYLTPINNIYFKGETRYLCCDDRGKNRIVARYSYGKNRFGDTRGCSAMIQRCITDRSIAIEETIGRTHEKPTYRVYLADPYEIVGDKIKKEHDYIVYEKQPPFPDINNNPEDNNIQKAFSKIKAYLERYKTAELKRNGGNTETATVQSIEKTEAIVSDCINICKESNDIQNSYTNTKIKIKIKTDKIEELQENMESNKKELKNKTKLLITKENVLKKKIQDLEFWKNKKNAKFCIYTQGDLDEIINKKMENITKRNKEIGMCKIRIAELEQQINNIPNKIETLKQEICKYDEQLPIMREKLASYYEKILQIYIKNGIRPVGKI